MDLIPIFSGINVALIVAMVILIQAIKSILSKKITIHKNVWFIVVLLSGIPQALLFMGSSNLLVDFNVWYFIQTTLMFSAGTMLFYKTGKFAFNIKEFAESFNKNSNSNSKDSTSNEK